MGGPENSKWDGRERLIYFTAGNVVVSGNLAIPHKARGIVLFAHGSGSSRYSPRNRFVAHALQKQHLATLLFDLLTPEEESIDQLTAQFRFDIGGLAQRLAGATDWIVQHPDTAGLPIGYFGASTGAAAALMAAAQKPDVVAAVVSRGGRPDLAKGALLEVHAPTLFVVGGHDEPVIELNQQALLKLGSEDKKLLIIPDATHLFPEHGALEAVAKAAGEWFTRYLIPAGVEEAPAVAG
jgi:putative phosphoribosyl transferase